MKKILAILAALAAVAMLGFSAAGVAINWNAQKQMVEMNGSLSALRTDFNDLREQTLQQLDSGEDVAQEDDVVIAGTYTIKSTKAISDAYLTGDRSALDDKQKETLDMASGILEGIITEGMSPYEKEKAVYEWMTRNLTHDGGLLTVIPETEADCDNPYGVLKYHNAVCVGYATTFRLFMEMLEIPCKVVHNSERYHSWDLINLDGGWYHTDIYSDVGSCNYSHFNMTDSIWGQSQSWNRDYFPAADKTEFCYVCMGAVEEKDLYHVPAALREVLDRHENLLSLRFGKDLTETDAQIVQQMLEDAQNRLNYSEEFSQMYMEWSWLPLEEGYVLAVNINWYNDDPYEPVEIPEDAYEKMSEAVDNAFGDLNYSEYEYGDWEDDPGYLGPVG